MIFSMSRFVRVVMVTLLIGQVFCHAVEALEESVRIDIGDARSVGRDVQIPIDLSVSSHRLTPVKVGNKTCYVPDIPGASTDVPAGYPALPYVVLRFLVPLPPGSVHEKFDVKEIVTVNEVMGKGSTEWSGMLNVPVPYVSVRLSPSGMQDMGSPREGRFENAILRASPGAPFEGLPHVTGKPFYRDVDVRVVLWLARLPAGKGGLSGSGELQVLRRASYMVTVRGASPEGVLTAKMTPRDVLFYPADTTALVEKFQSSIIEADLSVDLHEAQADYADLTGDLRMWDCRGRELRPESIRLTRRNWRGPVGGKGVLNMAYEVVMPTWGGESVPGDMRYFTARVPVLAELLVRNPRGEILGFRVFGLSATAVVEIGK